MGISLIKKARKGFDSMAMRIIRANNLSPANVYMPGSAECHIDDSIRNRSGLDILYNKYVKGKGKDLEDAFQREILGAKCWRRDYKPSI